MTREMAKNDMTMPQFYTLSTSKVLAQDLRNGHLDMSGNVWEWCLSEQDHPQRTGLSGTARRVMRGGSWGRVLVDARVSFRGGGSPGYRGDDLGLRVVRSSPSLA